MKAFPYILCFSFFVLFACNNEQTPKPTEGPKTETVEPPAVTSPSTTTSDNESPSNIEPAAINYPALATAYCKCAENTVSVNDKLAKLMESGDNAAFEAMLPTAEKAFKEAMDCCRDAKFQQSTAAVDQKKLFKPLKKTCPNLPNQLMLKMVTEIK